MTKTLMSNWLRAMSVIRPVKYKADSWLGDYETAYQAFLADPDGFWDRIARELDWIRPWDAVKEWKYPYARWFVNAKLNITANCLDRHVKNHRRNKVALLWQGEEGAERIYTYQKLLRSEPLCKWPQEDRREER